MFPLVVFPVSGKRIFIGARFVTGSLLASPPYNHLNVILNVVETVVINIFEIVKKKKKQIRNSKTKCMLFF